MHGRHSSSREFLFFYHFQFLCHQRGRARTTIWCGGAARKSHHGHENAPRAAHISPLSSGRWQWAQPQYQTTKPFREPWQWMQGGNQITESCCRYACSGRSQQIRLQRCFREVSSERSQEISLSGRARPPQLQPQGRRVRRPPPSNRARLPQPQMPWPSGAPTANPTVARARCRPTPLGTLPTTSPRYGATGVGCARHINLDDAHVATPLVNACADIFRLSSTP